MDITAYRAISIPNAHMPWTALLAKKKMLAPTTIELLITPILNIELPAPRTAVAHSLSPKTLMRVHRLRKIHQV